MVEMVRSAGEMRGGRSLRECIGLGYADGARACGTTGWNGIVLFSHTSAAPDVTHDTYLNVSIPLG